MNSVIALVPLRRALCTRRPALGIRTIVSSFDKTPSTFRPCEDRNGFSGQSRVRARDSTIRSFHSTSLLSEPAKRDYYEVLGASRGDSKKELKKKYRKLVKEHHPDQNAGDAKAAERYREIVEANEILQDDEKREIYDRYGHAGLDGSAGGGPGFDGFGGMGGMGVEDIFNIFGGFDGGRRGSKEPPRGADLQYNIPISFMEAVRGVHKQIHYTADTKCETCDATGAKDGIPETETCSTCSGTGIIRMHGRMYVCNACSGSRIRLKNPCGTCHGSGVTKAQRDHGVDIPAGIDHGQTMRVAGGGNDGERGGPPGSLYLNIIVDPDPYFVRDHANIHTEVPISVSRAILGGTVPVATLDGEVEVTVKPGTTHGTVLRLRGKGIRDVQHGVRGDQFVKFSVEFPSTLTEKQKQLMKEFEEEDLKQDSNCDTKAAKLVKAAVDRVKKYMSN